MTTSIHLKNVLEYYDTCWVSRFETGHNPQSLAMHMGYFQQEAISNDAAKINMNKYIVQCLQLPQISTSTAFNMIDAGCGVGGTSIYIAQQFPFAQISAVNISASQLAFFEKKINALQLTNIQLVRADYCNTALSSNTYDALIAIESLCHADDKEAFFHEAFRLLKPGGKLLILDYLQASNILKADVKSDLELFQKGWAVPQYLFQPEYLLEKAGFKNFTIHNITDSIKPGVENSYHAALKKIKLLNGSMNPTIQKHLKACIALKKLVDSEGIQYISILTEKSV